MTAHVPILPGCLLITKDGQVKAAANVTSAPLGAKVIVTRYIVAMNHRMLDGTQALLPLTTYLQTEAAATRALADQRKQFPGAAIIQASSLFDPAIPGHLEELRECERLAAAERAEGLQ